MGQVVGDPGTHGREQELRLERGPDGDESDAGRGLGQKLGEPDAQLRGVIDVDDEKLGEELPQRADLLLTEGDSNGAVISSAGAAQPS